MKVCAEERNVITKSGPVEMVLAHRNDQADDDDNGEGKKEGGNWDGTHYPLKLGKNL